MVGFLLVDSISDLVFFCHLGFRFFHLVGIVSLYFDHHEITVTFDFTVFDHVAKSCTACERGFAKIHFIGFGFESARAQILCLHSRVTQQHQNANNRFKNRNLQSLG